MDDIIALLIYLLGVNIITFILMGVDKRKAKRKAWRIPERTFWSLALIGGALGSMLGMSQFRHKTKHRSFVIGMPLLLLLNIGLLIYFGFFLP